MVKFSYQSPYSFFAQYNSGFQPATQSANNDFPRYSISIYDDANFLFKRQSVNGKQIISNTISDDYFSYDVKSLDTSNYLTGINYQTKKIYIKILVHKYIYQDTIGSISNVFYLSKIQSLGVSNSIYYAVTCIAKDQNYTTYSCVISISLSDFIAQSDGNVYFNLVGDYNVSLNYPINLTITNASPTSINQTTTSQVLQTISSSINTNNYFSILNPSFSYYEYSNTLDYNFIGTSITLSNILFSSTPNLFTTGTSGSILRFTFANGTVNSGFYYFGMTLNNSDITFNPNNDAYYSLTFRMQNGSLYKVEPKKILNNNTAGYYNIIFEFNNVAFLTTEINYILLEIKTLRSTLITPYNITFLGFLNTSDGSFETFSFKSLSNEHYTLDPLGNSITLSELKNKSLIKSKKIYTIVDGLIDVCNDINYEIQTIHGSVILPENTLIKTDQNFILVQDLINQFLIDKDNNHVKIMSLKIKPFEKVTLIDTVDNSDYVLSGLCIKNPMIKNINQRKFLPEISKNTSDFISVDDNKIFLNNFSNFYASDCSLILSAGENHNFVSKFSIIKMSFKQKTEIILKYKTKERFFTDVISIELDGQKNDFQIKSKDLIEIEKILAK